MTVRRSTSRATATRGEKRQRQLEDCTAAPSEDSATKKLSMCDTPVLDEADGVTSGPRPPTASASSTIPVLCREHEALKLADLIQTALRTRQGVPIYVPGQPGSGKTHTVKAVIAVLASCTTGAPPVVTYLNCMDKQASHIGAHICTLLTQRRSAQNVAIPAAGETRGEVSRLAVPQSCVPPLRLQLQGHGSACF
jgi:hypothetical protein